MQNNVQFKQDNEVLDYILGTGNRISQAKYELDQETRKLFPEDAMMITYPPEAELLKMLVQLTCAKKGIEIGVFTGMSSISIAEGLPDDGKLLCYDISEPFTTLAKKYWKICNVDHKIELTLGPALDSLNSLAQEESNLETFDFAYVDADKFNYLNYYEVLLKLIKPNGFIIFDNTLWSKRVIHPEIYTDQNTIGLSNLNNTLQTDNRVTINMLNIADGITIVRKV